MPDMQMVHENEPSGWDGLIECDILRAFLRPLDHSSECLRQLPLMMTRARLETTRSFSERWFKSTKVSYVDSVFGIKAWYEPSDAEVDIVFVHGITGHREHTWTAARSDGPWPRILLPASLPQARLLTFGYDASVVGRWSGVSQNRIGDHSRNLLSALAAHRAGGLIDSRARPLIFVAHSLGGLIVKDALLASRTSPEKHLGQILECVFGVLFLATPHAGSDLAVAAERCARAASQAGARTNMKIVQVLRRDSEVLERIQHDFAELLRMRQFAIDIVCFYEELPMPGIGIVVAKNSAAIPGHVAIGIHHHHRDVARFADGSDPGYISVLGELRRLIASNTIASQSSTLQNSNEYDEHGCKGKDQGVGTAKTAVSATQEKLQPVGGVAVWGNVTNSVVVSGSVQIGADLVFRR